MEEDLSNEMLPDVEELYLAVKYSFDEVDEQVLQLVFNEVI
jgi:hypothetical protein